MNGQFQHSKHFIGCLGTDTSGICRHRRAWRRCGNKIFSCTPTSFGRLALRSSNCKLVLGMTPPLEALTKNFNFSSLPTELRSWSETKPLNRASCTLPAKESPYYYNNSSGQVGCHTYNHHHIAGIGGQSVTLTFASKLGSSRPSHSRYATSLAP
jgi:hypothetical protein